MSLHYIPNKARKNDIYHFAAPYITSYKKFLENVDVECKYTQATQTPAPKDKSVSFPLPNMNDAMDASKAASSVLTAVSEGELTPIEGNTCHGAYR